jgi:hypothetical protein
MRKYLTIENLFIALLTGWATIAVFNLAYVVYRTEHNQAVQAASVVEAQAANQRKNQMREDVEHIRKDLRIIRHDIQHIAEMLEDRP